MSCAIPDCSSWRSDQTPAYWPRLSSPRTSSGSRSCKRWPARSRSRARRMVSAGSRRPASGTRRNTSGSGSDSVVLDALAAAGVVAAVDHRGVAAGAAVDVVVLAAAERVDLVIAGAAQHAVIAGVGTDLVVAGATVEEV